MVNQTKLFMSRLPIGRILTATHPSRPVPSKASVQLFLWLCVLCQAAAVPLQAYSEGWLRGDSVEYGELVNFRVALKQNYEGVKALEDAVLAVSDPSSALYGQHLTVEAVQHLVAPPTAAQKAVRSWLREGGVVEEIHASSNGDFMSALLPAATIERLLGTPLYHFSTARSGLSIIRTREAMILPYEIRDVVDFITPGWRFPAVRNRRLNTPPRTFQQDRPAPTPTKEDISPKMLRTLYNVTSTGGKSDVSQAVASFLHEYFSPADLLEFQQEFSPESQGRTPKVVGSNVPDSPTLEASLDVEYLMSVAPSSSTEFWYTMGKQPHNPGAEPFIEFLAQISETADKGVPKVFSISYADDENQVDVSYARRVSVELQKAGARGISILVASGDFGVGGNTNQICHGKAFIPTFPASSPYITAVGGTWYHAPEIAFEISSGGFSNFFPRPAYQDKAVKGFLKSAKKAGKLPPSAKYNATGRAFPDISAQSANFPIKVNGKDDAAYGTSCAAPVVSGIITLLNDERIAAGKSTLGFLNPLIYSILDQGLFLFNDITSGHNPGCGLPGFWAQAGWDPVTGAGTPNFGKLKDYVLSLP